jgi:hypothetical protein
MRTSMTRRLLTFAAFLALAVGAGGCAAAGGDAGEALEILERAEQAEANVESITFGMNMKGEAAGQSFTMRVDGAGYVRGENEGDMVMTMAIEGPGVPPTTMQMVALDERLYANLGGSWQEIPGGLAGAPNAGDATALEQQFAGLDIAEYVEDVRVERGTTFLGEPVTKIVGTIATEDLMRSVLGQLGSAGGGAPGLAGLASAEQLLDGVNVDDIRAVLYVSDVTDLVRAAHMEFAIDAAGQSMTFDIDMSIRSVNEPVEIPQPALAA